MKWEQTSANELTLRVIGLFDIRIFWQDRIWHIRYGRSDESERVTFDSMSEEQVTAHAINTALDLVDKARAELQTMRGELPCMDTECPHAARGFHWIESHPKLESTA